MESKISFKQFYLYQILTAAIQTFAGSFVILYFTKLGFSYLQVLIYYPFFFIGATISVLFLRRHNPVRLMQAGIIIESLVFLLLMNLPKEQYLLFLVNFSHGIYLTFFWVPCNTLYFRMGDSSKTAFHSSLTFLVYPLMNTFMPLVGGSIIQSHGFPILFAVASFSTLITFVISDMFKYHKVDFSLSSSVPATKKVMPILLLEGFWQGVDWITLPLISFYFFTSGISYGSFLSYIGLAGAVSSLFLGKLSDRFKQRRLFTYSIVVLLGFSTISAGLFKSKMAWILLRGAVSFLVAILGPFTVSVLLDHVGKAKKVMVVRELMLNVGRTLGSILVLVIFGLTGSIHIPLLISGLALLLYPLIVEETGIYPEKFRLKKILNSPTNDLIQPQ